MGFTAAASGDRANGDRRVTEAPKPPGRPIAGSIQEEFRLTVRAGDETDEVLLLRWKAAGDHVDGGIDVGEALLVVPRGGGQHLDLDRVLLIAEEANPTFVSVPLVDSTAFVSVRAAVAGPPAAPMTVAPSGRGRAFASALSE